MYINCFLIIIGLMEMIELPILQGDCLYQYKNIIQKAPRLDKNIHYDLTLWGLET